MRRDRIMVLMLAAALLAGCGPAPEPDAAPPRVILVTGATGSQGGAVARELLGRGYAVRALTRSPGGEPAQALDALGAEVIRGDFDDRESLLSAMQGAWGVFAVTDFWEHGFDREVAHGRALIDAAETAGVQHFVYSSVAGVDQDSGLPHFESKALVEEALYESDLVYTILRPVEFMDNWQRSWDNIAAGRYRNPRSPGERHQWIAVRDIGYFVAEVFDHADAWAGRAVEIAGDELTLAELAATMSDVLGRRVEYVQVPWDAFAAAVGEDIAAMNRWFSEDGFDVNIESLRQDHPQLTTVRQYLVSLRDSAKPTAESQ